MSDTFKSNDLLKMGKISDNFVGANWKNNFVTQNWRHDIKS